MLNNSSPVLQANQPSLTSQVPQKSIYEIRKINLNKKSTEASHTFPVGIQSNSMRQSAY